MVQDGTRNFQKKERIFMNQRTVTSGKETRMMDIEALCAYISMGKTRAREFGEQCGAKRSIGKRVLYDKRVIDRYLDQMQCD